MFQIGAQNPGDWGFDRVDASVGRFDDLVGCSINTVTIISRATLQAVLITAPVEHVIAVTTVETVVSVKAFKGVVALQPAQSIDAIRTDELIVQAVACATALDPVSPIHNIEVLDIVG